MTTLIPVPLGEHAYRIAIGVNTRRQLPALLAEYTPLTPKAPALIVSNPQIWQHYGTDVQEALTQAGWQVTPCILPAGERYKTLRTVEKIYDAALSQRLERGSTLFALGGGVIGDMTGFAAATWLRGIAVVQIPTSLLAMVDAAIGGKTGVNHPQGKNLIGAFHQPRLVVIDPDVLATLPPREFRAGMAEVIKYGVIWDTELFDLLSQLPRLDRMAALPTEQLLQILQRSCQVKVDVVSKDEREAGLRAILNYGHTIGHALESMGNYRLLNHGEAVAIGMIAAGELAVALGYWSVEAAAAQRALILKAKLPTTIPPHFDVEGLLALLQHDKKVQAQQVRFILPTAIGHVDIFDQVPTELIRETLHRLQA
ncbi:3-dehydroquinate synthase [Thermosynechococcus sp. QKsg1]|uniref:3-dehydroquinate synthase n=1 Tax=unclassified Thermosynechococcus TaxID=2622553 RepID=UPI00122E1B88|nr:MULTISPECIES: 3-dehydroquinate synthase [unclassified Thermosynechococcus]QEQ00290.1 3-dehydroquinate synthase [Thermosynechococcus sp. CL-1]WJI29550.1 3-dehydroquinate synthase [Thermosynechococcus sp. B3]WNC87143.1 3-dehydroquinate synthase [Thermosynechococcus sp. QKsg1]